MRLLGGRRGVTLRSLDRDRRRLVGPEWYRAQTTAEPGPFETGPPPEEPSDNEDPTEIPAEVDLVGGDDAGPADTMRVVRKVLRCSRAARLNLVLTWPLDPILMMRQRRVLTLPAPQARLSPGRRGIW